MHCSSLSKSLAPGYRIGWVLPGKFLGEVAQLKRIQNISCPTLTQAAVAHFLQHGRMDHHLRNLRKPKTSSFPSGHATSAFMAATLLGSGRRPATKAAWFGVATLVAASRVHVKIHHASDIVAGAAIGVGMGAAVKRIWPIGNAGTRRGY